MSATLEQYETLAAAQEALAQFDRDHRPAVLRLERLQLEVDRERLELDRRRKPLEETLTEAESAFRIAALNGWLEDGEVPDYPGVRTEKRPSLTYKEPTVIAWIVREAKDPEREDFPSVTDLLSIRRQPFRALVDRGDLPIGVATYQSTPGISISKNLRQATERRRTGRLRTEDLLPVEIGDPFCDEDEGNEVTDRTPAGDGSSLPQVVGRGKGRVMATFTRPPLVLADDEENAGG